jgi:hypothetical protein
VAFESPDPAAASPPASCPRGGGHRGGASPSSELEPVAARCGASSFSPAVPPACHSQRPRPVRRGQSLTTPQGRDLRRLPCAQVALLPDLALGARSLGRWFEIRPSHHSGPSDCPFGRL